MMFDGTMTNSIRRVNLLRHKLGDERPHRVLADASLDD